MQHKSTFFVILIAMISAGLLGAMGIQPAYASVTFTQLPNTPMPSRVPQK